MFVFAGPFWLKIQTNSYFQTVGGIFLDVDVPVWTWFAFLNSVKHFFEDFLPMIWKERDVLLDFGILLIWKIVLG